MEESKYRVPVRATASVAVESIVTEAFDENAPHVLSVKSIRERFSGDIDAQSMVRALEYRSGDKSARLVSLQRVVGSLHGRGGTFVLQGEEKVAAGQVTATWFVVPGSATGDLQGLRGKGGFTGAFGKGSQATLDYWFEW